MLPLLSLALLFVQDDAAPAAVPAAPASSSALMEMIHNSGPLAFAVLILLLIASIFSWTVMLSKWTYFRRAQTQGTRFVRAFRKSGRLSEIASVAEQFKPSPLVTAKVPAAAFRAIHSASNAPRRQRQAKPSPSWNSA